MLKKDATKPGKAAASKGSAGVTAAKTKSAPRATARKTAASARQQDELQQRAYELWESEGRPEGREQAHWLQAQHEIAKGLKSRAGAKL